MLRERIFLDNGGVWGILSQYSPFAFPMQETYIRQVKIF
jgi:hypothetical protein